MFACERRMLCRLMFFVSLEIVEVYSCMQLREGIGEGNGALWGAL